MKFDSSVPHFVSKAPTEAMPFREARKETPDRTVNAILPFGIAIGTFIVSYIAVGAIAWGLRLPSRLPIVAAGVLALVSLWFWMWRLVKDRLLWSIEQIIGIKPIDDTPSVDRPPEIRIQIRHDDRPNMFEYLQLPVSPEQYEALRRGLADGKSFSEGNWCGGGRPFTKKDFLKLRSYLLEANIIAWRNLDYPAQGVTTTVYGKRVFRELIQNGELRRLPRPEYEMLPTGVEDDNATPS